MDRRFILAFLLSSVVIFGYYALFPPEPPKPLAKVEAPVVANQAQTENTTTQAAVLTAVPEGEGNVEIVAGAEATRKLITVEGPRFIATIDTKEGVLTSMKLKEHKYAMPNHLRVTKWVTSIFTGDDPSPKQWDTERLVEMVGDGSEGRQPFQVRLQEEAQAPVYYNSEVESISLADGPQTLVLTAQTADGLNLVKSFQFDPKTFVIKYDVEVKNPTANDRVIQPSFQFGTGPEVIEADRAWQPKSGGVYLDSDFETYDTDDFEELVTFQETDFAVAMDTYFVQGVKEAEGKLLTGHFEPVKVLFHEEETLIPSLVIDDGKQAIKAGESYLKRFHYFAGPKTNDDLLSFDQRFTASLDLGWLDFLALPLLAILRWVQGYVINWGVAIIILTLIVRLAMFPLALRGMKSMRKMSRLNPRIKHLRSKYENNKEKLNQEIMLLYQKNKINPIGGCLPLLMQIPIFIALYQALMPAIELRHQSFGLWMDNLSASDHTLILPILMGVTMWLQQLLTPQPDMDPLQRKIMMWMPVLMVVFFLDMPMGLVLYWVASNIFTIFQQLVFNRLKEAEIQH